jgi:hypothetical protein
LNRDSTAIESRAIFIRMNNYISILKYFFQTLTVDFN